MSQITFLNYKLRYQMLYGIMFLQRKTPPIVPYACLTLSLYDLWWNDPPWLKRASTTWPKHNLAMSIDTMIAEEISAEA
jgi:hypothetical protein